MTNLADRPLTATTRVRRLSAPEIRGRAAGILVLTFFGSSWVSWGSSTGVPDGLSPWIVGATIVLVLGSVVGAVFLFTRARTAPVGGSPTAVRAVRRRFGLVVFAEFAGLALAAVIIARTGHPEIIAAVVCAGVGVHFLPLARLFGVPLYRWTGLALCGISLLTILVASTSGLAAPWTMIPGFGAAATLFLTCALLLRESIRGSAGGNRQEIS